VTNPTGQRNFARVIRARRPCTAAHQFPILFVCTLRATPWHKLPCKTHKGRDDGILPSSEQTSTLMGCQPWKGLCFPESPRANRLYQTTLIELCMQLGVYFAVENPGKSFMWQTTPSVALQQRHCLQEVCFHHCQYGSSRRKLTKILHNMIAFSQLEPFCDNNHKHEPWGQSPDGHWRTSAETAYPWLSQPSWSHSLTKIVCSPPMFALQETTLQTMRATTDIEPRRGLPPMVSEFECIQQWPSHKPLPPLARALSTPSRGQFASASTARDTI
jgi:hypothetical protein